MTGCINAVRGLELDRCRVSAQLIDRKRSRRSGRSISCWPAPICPNGLFPQGVEIPEERARKREAKALTRDSRETFKSHLTTPEEQGLGVPGLAIVDRTEFFAGLQGASPDNAESVQFRISRIRAKKQTGDKSEV